ncbi:hypothetical protein Save01_06545 [Streptomyces avermitilis]|uniref:Putative T7SS secretion signal domain-containing protein n=2 Tax=Streptomyces avermitilis TaxID=33903 RepID=Q82RW9_STRAW|nr:hypothetical protein [Streptomyces avermitilis]BAC67732.1 hypothetical protein SAVERM_23 [Streptomyces avermitilis MA-4680 = NBRC 14893]BBJ47394.1 hypothetical protein SAVMC3_00230 [Streptomyces avermitilis]GDY69082.1 hypothetical protein SAV14893_084750 [Streptomyces avermitilis]GDY70538.1 hypothetical protein SAV31267_000230 [Streptomyces avermitilis]
MGLGDVTNSLLGGAENLYDAGKKKLGEGVDWATDKVGEGLDKVGAHDWADSVEDWGDEIASDLGPPRVSSSSARPRSPTNSSTAIRTRSARVPST